MDGKKMSEERFRTLFRLLRSAGLPIYMEKVPVAYKAYMLLILPPTYISLLAVFGDVVQQRNDLKLFMISTRVFIAIADFLWPLTYFSIFQYKLDRLIHITEQFTWEDLPTKDQTTMAGWINKAQVATKLVYLISMACHLIQSSYRIATIHELVFNSWYPFDTTQSPIHEIIIFSQFFGSHVIVAAFAGSTALYAVLVSVACSQLRKLSTSILNLRQKQDMEQELTECIRFHQQIIEYMNETETSLSIFLFVQMLILFIGICLVAFSAVTSWGDHVDVFQALLAYSMLTGHIFVLCWFGTKLTQEVESVRTAAWECGWVGTPISFQKTIMFIISRGNKEFALTAGKFVPMSNETLLNV
ncbi:hypothetical protein L9F63_017617, partial [Diploptera punctata]